MKASAFQSIWNSFCLTSVPAVSSVGVSRENNTEKDPMKAKSAFRRFTAVVLVSSSGARRYPKGKKL